MSRLTWWLVGLALIAAPAQAHDWFTGTSNPGNGFLCCGGDNSSMQDCGPIPLEAISEESGGYRVTLNKMQVLKLRPKGVEPKYVIGKADSDVIVDEIFPYAEVMPTEGKSPFNVCISYYPVHDRWLRCLFVPQNT